MKDTELQKFIRSEGSVTMDKLRLEYGDDFKEKRAELLKWVEEKVISKHIGSGGVAGYRYPFYTERDDRTEEVSQSGGEEVALDFIRDNPNCLTKEIKEGLNISQRTCDTFLGILLGKGLVEKIKHGREHRYLAVDEALRFEYVIKKVPKTWYKFSEGSRGLLERELVEQGLTTEGLLVVGDWGLNLWWPGTDPEPLPDLSGMTAFLGAMPVDRWIRVKDLKFSEVEVVENLTILAGAGMLEEVLEVNEREELYPGRNFKRVLPYETVDHSLIDVAEVKWRPKPLAPEDSLGRMQHNFETILKSDWGVRLMRRRFRNDEKEDLLFKGMLIYQKSKG